MNSEPPAQHTRRTRRWSGEPFEVGSGRIVSDVLTGRHEGQGVFGQDDVQTESEAFNRAYHVQGHDDRYAMAVVHPRMMELLMSAPETYWRIDRDSLVYWEPCQVEPYRFVQRLNLLTTIAGLIPSYVWKDYGR